MSVIKIDGKMFYDCPECGGEVELLQSYCQECGEGLDWNDEEHNSVDEDLEEEQEK